jgi:ketosteroid isomerase-like protein
MPNPDELIERLRQAHEAFNRGDVDAVLELFDPDVQVVRFGDQQDLRGVQDLREWMKPDAFASQTLEPTRFEVSGNRVLVHTRAIARGAGSGLEMEIDTFNLWTFDGSGKVVRIDAFLGHEEAGARQALEAD